MAAAASNDVPASGKGGLGSVDNLAAFALIEEAYLSYTLDAYTSRNAGEFFPKA